jgi:DNA-binding response OmpR family regulator
MPDMSLHKHAIALVEDDTSLSRAVGRLLRASEFEAHAFGSAKEFLESTAPESYVCLILDIHLPGMSGIDLLDHLDVSASPRLVIFITAQDEGGLWERTSRIPPGVHLCKPFVGDPDHARLRLRTSLTSRSFLSI